MSAQLQTRQPANMRPRYLVPRDRQASARTLQAHDALAAMVDVADALRSEGTPKDVFRRLVTILGDAFPINAVAIISARPDDEPLVWTNETSEHEPSRVVAFASAILGYFQSDEAFEEDERRTSATNAWLSLPIANDEGAVLGLLAVAPSSPIDEAALAFVACVATKVVPLLTRGWHLEQMFSSRDSNEWLPHATDLRLIEEQHARYEAESWAHAVAVASDATAVLLSSFDYDAGLRHCVRIVAQQLGASCVVDLAEKDGLHRIADVSTHTEPDVVYALAPLVAEVLKRSATAVATKAPHGWESDDGPCTILARRALRALDVDWLVCAPMAAQEQGGALGVLTMFGTATRNGPVPLAIAEELGRRAGLAIENGRRYVRAVDSLRERELVLAMVSHDLKNPLGVIQMSAMNLLDSMPPELDEGRPQLERIKRTAQRMTKLVSDLLDLEALDAGQLSMSPRTCPLRPLVMELFQELAPQAESAGLTLSCEIEDDLPPARADGHRVTQVLTNLIDNAVKFTPSGGHLSVRAALFNSEEIAVVVADNGIGISRDNLDRVFDRFWQGPNAFKNGSGLGLAICRRLIQRSGGRIWLESKPGVGTAVTFTLPVTPRSTSPVVQNANS